jgi:AbrB family looped-hinge helix DNA binding protein
MERYPENLSNPILLFK